MTTTLPTAAPTAADRTEPPTWSIGAPRLLAGLDTRAVLGLEAHLAVHGPPKSLVEFLDWVTCP